MTTRRKKRLGQVRLRLTPQNGGAYARWRLTGSLNTRIVEKDLRQLFRILSFWSGWPVELVLSVGKETADWLEWWTTAIESVPEDHLHIRFELPKARVVAERAADGNRCEPLTISDAHSRFLLKCQIVPNTRFTSVRPLLEAAFREYGLPKAMRTDNGPPFASVGLASLSQFTVWLTRLGIVHERIVPGHPEQNGRHERMHKTLKQETALPPQPTLGEQQRAFDQFRDEFNNKRPHEALGQRMPAEVYKPSERKYLDVLPEIVYPVNFVTRPIKKAGQFFWDNQRIYAHRALNGETLGFEAMTPRYWRVWFGPIVLAVFDATTFKLIATKPVYESKWQGSRREEPEEPPEPVPEPG